MTSPTSLTGLWTLVEGRAWDEHGHPLPPPYGARPMGHIAFEGDRMLAVLCDASRGVASGHREFSAYGGVFRFDGNRLTVMVDVASDPERVGGQQVRDVAWVGKLMLLRPPLRSYRGVRQQRELAWRQVGA